MCLAVAGIVLSMDDRYAKVDVFGNVCDVNVALVNARVGDYVLVHAGCAIEVVTKTMFDEVNELYLEIEGVMNES